MKVKYILILITIISFVGFGAIMSAQEADEEAAPAVEEATPAVEEATPAVEEAPSATAFEASAGMKLVRLVGIRNANSYRVILDNKEITVKLMGLDFSEANFYIFDQKHNAYVEWLLAGYQFIWIDYDPNRVDSNGLPLVELYYGPWDEERWQGPNKGQSKYVAPPRVNFWGETVEVYDSTVAQPFISYPHYSSLEDNWVIDPASGGRRQYTDNLGRTWYLRNLNAFVLLSGYADLDNDFFHEGNIDKRVEYKAYVDKAKWCRRGLWSTLLGGNAANEDICGVNKPIN